MSKPTEVEEIADFYGRDLQAEGLAKQVAILAGCAHEGDRYIHVWIDGREFISCRECLRAGEIAYQSGRKEYLAAYWRSKALSQSTQLKDCQLTIGMRVERFYPSMLGLGGMHLTGVLVRNRNGMAVVKLDVKQAGKRSTRWEYGWRAVKDGAR